MLDLGESRFRVSDVVDLLDVAAVARRFGLGEETRARLEPWLRQARVAWGLDAHMKEEVGGAPIDANTWSFGFDRLYAGMIAGDDGASLVDGILPVAGVSGNDIDAIGRLDRFIETLRDLRVDLAVDRTLAAWSVWLLDLVDALFAIDIRDDAEDNAMSSLRRSIAALADQDDALDGEKLPWSIVRDVVRGALDTISERQPFLLGGVTFCGLVPQRSIPFRVVGLLGMNEGEYPRIASDTGLNRMQTHPRRGDRDTRSEDRYLFLEAVMAARQHLHLSYIGEDIGDGSRRNPASPLSELLEFFDEQFDVSPQAAADKRPWLVRHPLQPFDGRYYRRDPQLFSFDAAYAVATETSHKSSPFVDDDDVPTTPSESIDVSLKSLKAFWRDPSRARLRDDFGIGLDALSDDALLDREPMTASTEKRERFEAQLLDRAWRDGLHHLPDTAPTWLAQSGALPGGEVGARAYARMRARVQPMLTLKHERIGDDTNPTVVPIDLPIGDARLVGTVDNAFRRADGALHIFQAKAVPRSDSQSSPPSRSTAPARPPRPGPSTTDTHSA